MKERNGQKVVSMMKTAKQGDRDGVTRVGMSRKISGRM
jgi:hypothetical protein